jgi:RNA polymerase sigma factor (TIGR02999 family)
MTSRRKAQGAADSAPDRDTSSANTVARIPDALVRLAYEHLRQIAHGSMCREHAGHTLQTTALVHEAYLRLVNDFQDGRGKDWSQRQLLAAAGEAMRRILIEEARRTRRGKRGGGWQRIPLESADAIPSGTTNALDALALDEAVDRLAAVDPRMHEIVLLRYFVGLEIDQVAELMGLSPSTVDREWRCARMWLYEHIAGEPPVPPARRRAASTPPPEPQ